MSVGFGFSVGDIFATIEVVATVCDALRSSGLASSEYQELLSQLSTLEAILRRIQSLQPDDTSQYEITALRDTASLCRRTIDDFWNRAKKYRNGLERQSASSPGNNIRNKWRSVKWAVFKKDEILAFRTNLFVHVQALQVLLTMVQM